MQNEITELRNQVRTLKRFVCLVCCLFVFGMLGGCFSTPQASDCDELTGELETSPNTLTLESLNIAQMTQNEARSALDDVAESLQHVSRDDDETKKRLRNEMRLLLDRLKALHGR